MRVEITADDLAPNALRRWAHQTPDQVLLEHVDGRRLTYAEVVQRCDRWAAGFAAAGIGPGTPVGVFVDDSLEGALAWLAVTAAGMVAVPLNTAHVGKMLRHVLVTAEVRAVVASPGLIERFDAVCAGTLVERIVVLDDAWSGVRVDGVATTSAADLLAAGTPVEPTRPELHDTAMFLLTSGTTGPSKAVVIPWAASHSHWSWVPADMLGPGDALYAPVAMFHNSGIGALQFVVWRGGRLVMREKFSATAFWDDIRRTGAIAAGVVGPMTAVLWAQPERPDDADNPLRGLALGPMIEPMEAFERRFDTRVCTAYGMTEVPSMVFTGWDHGPVGDVRHGRRRLAVARGRAGRRARPSGARRAGRRAGRAHPRPVGAERRLPRRPGSDRRRRGATAGSTPATRSAATRTATTSSSTG